MLKRGFKTWCERLSISYRKDLGLAKSAPLAAHDLAKHLKTKILTPSEISGFSGESLNLLLGTEASSWSAVTLSQNSSNLIIHNPTHATSRQSNDLMHELAHLIVGHKPQALHSFEMGVFLRHYEAVQEEEADCLAAILLLPKDVLVKIKFSGAALLTAATEYGVSLSLLNMRLNTSGMNHIYKNSTKKIVR